MGVYVEQRLQMAARCASAWLILLAIVRKTELEFGIRRNRGVGILTGTESNLRIGVIGAGASGLATAHALRGNGFRQVTVLERESAPGGKCCTFWHRDRSYELGAAVITPQYRQTWELAREVGLTPSLTLGVSYVNARDGDVHKLPYLPPVVGLLGGLRLAGETARALRAGLWHRLQQFPRLDLAHPSLAEPFESWCIRHDLRNLLEVMRPWGTAFGYGHMDETPAMYMLNYMCLMGPSYEFQDVGYRGLWQRVAQNMDVRYDTQVLRVERGATIRVHTQSEVLELDRIVIACPLEAALAFLDASEEERQLFSQVRYVDYQVVAAEVSDMPKWRYMFVPRHFGRESADKTMFYYRRYPDRDLITFYSFMGAGGLEGAEREAIKLAERMGGRVRSIVTRRAWRYFPHVSSESIRAGFHQQLEALQGRQNTYYASEVSSFSCVEPVVAYANDLVRRHFVQALASYPEWLSRSTPENTQAAIAKKAV